MSEPSSPVHEPPSPTVAPDELCEGARAITFALLHGPVIQFAQPAAQAASVVAMPPQLPLSVDTIFSFPAAATLPDNLAHFCFAPVLKMHEPSELSFTLTDSSGAELYGVSLQVLCAHASSSKQQPSAPKHRPVALCLLSGRPLFGAMSRLLNLLLPLIGPSRLPTTKRTRQLKVRIGRDQYGLGLTMSPNNTIMSVEAGSVAARERRLRPGDQITEIDGEAIGGDTKYAPPPPDRCVNARRCVNAPLCAPVPLPVDAPPHRLLRRVRRRTTPPMALAHRRRIGHRTPDARLGRRQATALALRGACGRCGVHACIDPPY